MRKQDIEKLLQALEFSANQEPPAEQIIWRIQFQTIGTLGDYALITGRPKAGKTKYLAGAMAASISREEIFGMLIKLPDEKRRVVHFDTEQGRRSHYNVLSLTMQLVNFAEMPQYFHSFHCRQDGPAQIIAMIEYFLDKHPDTGILFLDGLLDLIESFNDEKHSKALVNWLKRITEQHNVFIVGILHRSMSADKSIGHLGSSADRAAQSVLIVEKVKETKQYVLRPEYLRDADEFEPVAIQYSKQLKIWQQVEYIPEGEPERPVNMKRKPHEYDIPEHSANVVRIFNSKAVQPYDELLQRIVEVYAVGRQWAKQVVPILERENLIWKTADGFTNIRQGRLLKVE